MSTDPLQLLFQFGVLAAALVLAGLAMLLQRRPEPIPDWPPSPPPSQHVRRDLVVTSAALGLIVAGVGMAVLAIAVTIWAMIAAQG
jgi:uncharacterized iron-regulated membrane protein